MAVTNPSTSTKRSWADIVKGPTVEAPIESPLCDTPADPELQPSPSMDVPAQSVLQPGRRGERRCFCQGEVLVMLGHYGWIMTFDEIDHPDVGRTAGRVYVHKRDVAKGASLAQGDTVSFYLYADDQGLGAEHCRLEHRAASDLGYGTSKDNCVLPEDCYRSEEVSNLRADAEDFVPGAEDVSNLRADAEDFVPGAEDVSNLRADAEDFVPGAEDVFNFRADADDFVPGGACPAPSWNVCAADFVPTPSTITGCFNAQAAEFVPSERSIADAPVQDVGRVPDFSSVCASNPNVLSINPAFLSDDESDGESGIVSSDDSSGFDGDKESNHSDDESVDSDMEESDDSGNECEDQHEEKESALSILHHNDIEWSSDLDAVVLHVPLKSPRASSVDDSTSVGPSDSEADDAMRFGAKTPPGLSLPKGWRPPPGLTLPGMEA